MYKRQVVISDGDANGLSVARDPNANHSKHRTNYGGAIINIMGRHVKMDDTRRGATAALLENIKKRFDTTTIGFFLADSSHNFKYKIQDCDREAYYGDDFKPYNREYQKNKCVTFKGKLGYDELYIVKSWKGCLLYTSPSTRDKRQSRMPSSA